MVLQKYVGQRTAAALIPMGDVESGMRRGSVSRAMADVRSGSIAALPQRRSVSSNPSPKSAADRPHDTQAVRASLT